MALISATRPRFALAAAARELLARQPRVSVLLQGVAAVSAITTLLASATMLASRIPLDMMSALMLSNPLIWAGTLFVVCLVFSAIISHGGRMFGGQGSFEQSLLLVLWVTFIQMGVQGGQLLVISVSQMLALLLSLAGTIWSCWAMTHFVKVMHGFDNGIAVFFGIAMAFVASMMVTVFLMFLLGVFPDDVVVELTRGVEP